MGRSQNHCRLAITPFDDTKALLRTVVDLFAAGLQCEQLCLIGLTIAVADVTSVATSLDGQLDGATALFKDMREWPSLTDGHQIVATAGPVLEALLKTTATSSDPTSRAGITTKPSADIESRVRAGTIVLVVKSSNPRQQLLATRTLLDNSSHHVTTYEFSLP